MHEYTNHEQRVSLATLLRRGAGGYAARAAELLLEQMPDAGTAFGEGAFRRWQAHFAEQLHELAAGVELDDVEVFRANVRWNARAFLKRDVPLVYVAGSLTALSDALAEELPPPHCDAASQMVRAVIGELARADGDQAADVLRGGLSPLALRYMEAAMSGRAREAIELVVNAAAETASPADIYEDVLLPVEAEVGHMWHDGEIEVWEEHLVTETTRSAMSIIAHHAHHKPARDEVVLLGTLADDNHGLGLRAVADLLELDGYRVINLGSELPERDWLAAIKAHEPAALVISVSLRTGLVRLLHLMQQIRAAEKDGRRVRVIVGGPALRQVAVEPAKLEVDAVATSPRHAVACVAELFHEADG